jgi:hypothetical protein
MLAPADDDLCDASPRDVRTDADWIAAYRAGFHDAADGYAEQRSAEAYLAGYRAGDHFWASVTATRPYHGPSHFLGWALDFTNLPPALKYWQKGSAIGGLRGNLGLAFKHGGDRKSEAFKAFADTERTRIEAERSSPRAMLVTGTCHIDEASISELKPCTQRILTACAPAL